MRRFSVLAFVALPLILTIGRTAEPESVSALIAQLGSPRFAQRQAAVRALTELGDDALEELRRGATSSDLEVRRQCQELLRRSELRRTSAKMLAVERILLSYKDTPLTEALANFNLRTGLQVQIVRDLDRLKDRTVTLETEAVSKWEAFDRFCRAAGLVERDLWMKHLASEEELRSARLEVVLEQQELVRSLTDSTPLGRLAEIQARARISVVPGKLPAYPVGYAGALRVRVLPTPPGAAVRTPGDEVRISLDVTPAPHLRWLGIAEARLSEVVDDQGQKLESVVLQKPLERPVVIDSDSVPARLEQMLRWEENRKADVCVRLGRKPAQRLGSVRGTLVCQLLTEPEPLLVIEQILEADSRTAEDAEGRTLSVIEVTPEKNGKVEMVVQVRRPIGKPRDSHERSAIIRKYFEGEFFNESVKALELHDGKGARLRCLEQTNVSENIEMNWVYTCQARLKFQSGPEQGEPAKLLLMGRRPILVEAPFTLSDVPLP